MDSAPATLQEAILHFAVPENCHEFMVKLRWPDGVVKCPHCGGTDVSWLPNAKVFKCYAKHALQKFSLKVGTIFEESPIGLDKWLPVMWLLVNSRNGVSSWEIHRSLGVTQKTAWFMLQRARLAVQDDLTGGNLNGEVEVDETFIGGKVRNMHKVRKEKVQAAGGRTEANKTIVLGILQRKGHVRAAVIPDRRKKSIEPHVLANVADGATINTDEFSKGWYRDEQFIHNVVNHAVEYVQGNVHTNGMENFWSLLKRMLGGTYISVEPFHLFRYLDEQMFRYNHRKDEDGKPLKDADRFVLLCKMVAGCRLTWNQVTGKELAVVP